MASRTRFLIDECLSPRLAEIGGTDGNLTHVNFRGLNGASDRRIARWCVDHDHALITNNARHFRTIYARLPVHPGLVVILPNVERAQEVILLKAVLAAIAAMPDLINRLVEIDPAGQVTISDFPAGAP